MATTIFLIVAAVFVIAVFSWMRSWNKNDEPKVNGGGGTASGGNNDPQTAEVLMVTSTEDVLFGKDGKLVKGETFYDGKIKDNSQLYLKLSMFVEGAAWLCGINGCDGKPRMQIALELDNKRCICNPCNSQRQSVQPYIVHESANVWLSSDVLNGIALPEYFVLRILWRLDNGNGYGAWIVSDAINIHNK